MTANRPSSTNLEELLSSDQAFSGKSSKTGIEGYAAFVVFWTLAAVVFIQFASRYLFNSSIAWTEEIARYLLIFVTFLGSAVAVRKRSHIAVEFMYRYMPQFVVSMMRLILDVSVIVFSFWLAWMAYKVADLTKNQHIVTMEISKAYIYGVVCIGFILMGIRGLQVMLLDAFNHKK